MQLPVFSGQLPANPRRDAGNHNAKILLDTGNWPLATGSGPLATVADGVS